MDKVVFNHLLKLELIQMENQVVQVEVLVQQVLLRLLQEINREPEIILLLLLLKAVMVVLVHIQLQIMEEVVVAELLLLVQMDQDLLQVMAEPVLQLQ